MAPILQRLLANFANARAFESSIHISEEFRFVFFNNPKAGCSTTKATFNLECARRLGTPLSYSHVTEVHQRGYNVLKTPAEVGHGTFVQMLDDPQIVKFCLLREPLNRVLATYENKLTRNTPQRRKLNTYLARPPDNACSRADFIAAICADDAARDLDKHWTLQSRNVCADVVRFTYIGFHPEIEESLRTVGRLIFGQDDLRVFDVRELWPLNATDISHLSLSDDERVQLSKAYAGDIELYEAARKQFSPFRTPALALDSSA